MQSFGGHERSLKSVVTKYRLRERSWGMSPGLQVQDSNATISRFLLSSLIFAVISILAFIASDEDESLQVWHTTTRSRLGAHRSLECFSTTSIGRWLLERQKTHSYLCHHAFQSLREQIVSQKEGYKFFRYDNSTHISGLEQVVYQLVEQLFQFMKKVKMIEVVCCFTVKWSPYL